MSFLAKLFARREDDRAIVRPLWHRVVEISREPQWYSKARVADTVAGRFDTITMVISLVLMRMERDPALVEPSVRLTELFVDDMDGQLRESGVGDMVVGKHVGRLMGALGGRLGTYRDALASADGAALTQAVARNMSFAESGGSPEMVAAEMRVIEATLAALSPEALLAGEIAR